MCHIFSYSVMNILKHSLISLLHREGPSQGLMPTIFHKEFPSLVNLEEIVREIKSREEQGLWEEVEVEREGLVDLLLEGIQYYQRYQAVLLTWLIQVIIDCHGVGHNYLLNYAGYLCSLYLFELEQSVERTRSCHHHHHSLCPPPATGPCCWALFHLLLRVSDPPAISPGFLLPGSSVCLAQGPLNTIKSFFQQRLSDKNSLCDIDRVSAHPALHRCIVPSETLA